MNATDAGARNTNTGGADAGGAPLVVVLIGFMGSGKSSIARRLAWRLNCRATDLDKRIEEQCGAPVAELFAARGEAAFRAAEGKSLRDALREVARDGGVISTGGGIVKDASNRAALKAAAARGALVVYLRARPATLAQRIRRQPGTRPLIDGDEVLDAERTCARVAELLSERDALYEECAHAIVDTDELSLQEVVEAIATRLERRATGSAPKNQRGEETRHGTAKPR